VFALFFLLYQSLKHQLAHLSAEGGMLRIQKISIIAAFLLLVWSVALTLPASPTTHFIITLVSTRWTGGQHEK
jgi:hypothetical protein